MSRCFRTPNATSFSHSSVVPKDAYPTTRPPTKGGATTTTRELECHRLRPVMTGFLTHFGPLVMPGLVHGVLGRLIGS